MDPVPVAPAPPERVVPTPAIQPSSFPANRIRTSKYTYWSFLPKNLYEQFHKVSNLYFLFNAILQVIPMISVSDSIPTVTLPLLFLLTLSAVRDFVEDYRRWKSDSEENAKKVEVSGAAGWEEREWREVQVGTVVRVKEGQYFPADLVLVATQEEKGICYVETKNIDGETNLKHKAALPPLQAAYHSDEQLFALASTITCDAPNDKIYRFQGKIEIGDAAYPLDQEQMLLRGSSLRHTGWVTGIVVYTGHDTKMLQSSTQVRFKYSHMEDQLTQYIVIIVLLQVAVCVVCASYYTLWFWQTEDDTEQYLDLDSSHNNLWAQFFIAFGTWMLIFTSFVPISLIVTLEMVKYFQGLFIAWDLGLYYEETDTPATVQTSNLNEELGQITHIFTDKTGTLTANEMVFRKFSANGRAYGTSQHMTPRLPSLDFVDPEYRSSPEILDFMRILAVCHTVTAEAGANAGDEAVYRAASPDELALVEAAKYFGVRFLGRTEDHQIHLEVNGQSETITLLQVLEFTSDRKRMSVIVEMEDGTVKLMCKGSDAEIKERLEDMGNVEQTESHLEDFANEGLRTLMVAEKEWDRASYDSWKQQWDSALLSISDRDVLKSQLANEAEAGLRLSGATAIEDRLQDGVPTSIAALKKAGISVWMLTGDKVETAVNVGFACSMLTPHMEMVRVDGKTKREVRAQLTQARFVSKSSSTPFVLIVTGDALEVLQPDLKDLIKIAEKCETVLCCRITPHLKALIVTSAIRYNTRMRALAIGDGANDVNMITAAHIGVGIAGLEGTEAVRASDFSIAQFRFLKRLLFVHGRECYRRNAVVVWYNFYKNMLLVLPLFWYGTMSAFSGQILYNMWTYNLYNMSYAFFPIFLYALFDKEMPLEELEANPKYYRPGKEEEGFNKWVFWKGIGEAALKSVIICFLTFFSLCYYTGDESNGKDPNIWHGGIAMYCIIVLIANLYVLRFSYMINWIFVLFWLASVGSFFLSHFLMTEWLPIAGWLDNYDMRGATYKLFLNPNAYSVAVLLIALCFMFYPIVQYTTDLIDIFRKRSSQISPPGAETDSEDDPLLLNKERFSRYTGVISRGHSGFAFSQEDPVS